MNILTLKKDLQEMLWQYDLDTLPVWQQLTIKLARIFQAVIRDLASGLPTLRAMSLVYTTLLSLVPLLAVGFSVLKGFGVHNQIEPMLLHLLSPLGSQGVDITKYIISFVDNIKVGILGVMGIALLFYTVVTLIQKIERAFNSTWHISEYRGLAQRISDYLSIIMVGPVLIFSALAMTATITSSSAVTAINNIQPFGYLFGFVGAVLPYILVIVAFTFIYMLIPNTRVKFRSALVGGVIAGILWETTGWLFASFVAGSSNYTAVYSGFAILIIFMIWLYLSWLILLTGSSIAYYHQHPESITKSNQPLTLSCQQKEKIALLVMFRIASHFHHNKTPWTLETLAENLNLSIESLSDVLKALEKNKIIIPNSGKIISYFPAQSLENISIVEILFAMRCDFDPDEDTLPVMHSEPVIDELVESIEQSVHSGLNRKSLRDLIN